MFLPEVVAERTLNFRFFSLSNKIREHLGPSSIQKHIFSQSCQTSPRRANFLLEQCFLDVPSSLNDPNYSTEGRKRRLWTKISAGQLTHSHNIPILPVEPCPFYLRLTPWKSGTKTNA